MINDTVAQSSTDSSAIQIPKYFFKIIFFKLLIISMLSTSAIYHFCFWVKYSKQRFSLRLHVYTCIYMYIYIKSDADGCMHHLFHAIQQSYKHVKKHDSVIRLTHFRHFLHVYQFSVGLYCT